MKVTLKDGSCKEYSQAMAIIDIARDILKSLKLDNYSVLTMEPEEQGFFF